MINHELFTKVEPSFEKVLALKNDSIDFNYILELLEKCRDEVTPGFWNVDQ